MYQSLGKFIERWWSLILVAWLFMAIGAVSLMTGSINRLGIFARHIPTWKDVAVDGEFAHLPKNMQSLEGERLLEEAFPEDATKSTIVIVARRSKEKLTPADDAFIKNTLIPRLGDVKPSKQSHITRIRTPNDSVTGKLLVSQDQQAVLVVIGLSREFLEHANRPIIDQVEKLINKDLVLEKAIPEGLDVVLSGSATVGRDMLVANNESAKKTELWTTILVVALLVLLYRAPILALIPLVTVFVSVQISLALLTLLTQISGLNFHVFMGMEVYITVVVYGAGVDYCLFLIARYKEEIDSGIGLKRGVSTALMHVGAALAASAGTVIVGIGMMAFAQFGKFREAGIGIALSLCVVLVASLTLTPALLRFAGGLAFWPYGRSAKVPKASGWITGTSLLQRLMDRNPLGEIWERAGQWIVRHPGKILAGCVAVMTPFAIVGVLKHSDLSYGLLSELPTWNESVKGARAVQQHFPAGYAGPLTILLRHEQLDFNSPEGTESLDTIAHQLEEQAQSLGIADVRYLSHPLGTAVDTDDSHLSNGQRILQLGVQKKKSRDYYVSSVPEHDGKVTRLDIIFRDDPFSRESMRELRRVENVLQRSLPNNLQGGMQMLFVGPTASIRDLKLVTDADQVRIDVLVLVSVFVILVVLLRKPAICLYLIVSVFFSYFVTLGVTIAVFWSLNPSEFAGLDWKVPMFLFTILIAVGEDYNIFLMTRIEEEQLHHGPVEGVRIALLRTGSIISSCGIIMAGTFLSLVIAGTLLGMQQLGFALAFGVLLDTFVVRPILVPAYLVLLYSGRFGNLGRFLGQSAFENLSRSENPI